MKRSALSFQNRAANGKIKTEKLMEKLSRKKRTIISLILFFLIFGGLLLIATFYDLKINHILTSSSLKDHLYLTNDTFGASFEAFGDSPNYIMLTMAFSLIFIFARRNMKKAGQVVLMAAALAGTFASLYFWFNSVLNYIKEHLTMLDRSFELAEGPYLNVIVAFLALVVTFLSVTAANNFNDEAIKKLLRFSIATIIICAVPTAIINLGLKGYVGRIRYRAMDMYPDNPTYGFAAYARWFEHHGQWLSKEEMRELFGTSDALKSFPSGHTASAGCIYALTMLIDSLGIKKKGARIALWVCPIAYTGAVAVSRMVCGAHFLSDVLVGGTLSFVTMILSREFIIDRCEKIKALSSKSD